MIEEVEEVAIDPSAVRDAAIDQLGRLVAAIGDEVARIAHAETFDGLAAYRAARAMRQLAPAIVQLQDPAPAEPEEPKREGLSFIESIAAATNDDEYHAHPHHEATSFGPSTASAPLQAPQSVPPPGPPEPIAAQLPRLSPAELARLRAPQVTRPRTGS